MGDVISCQFVQILTIREKLLFCCLAIPLLAQRGQQAHFLLILNHFNAASQIKRAAVVSTAASQ